MKVKYEQVYNFFLRVCHRNILFVQTPRMTLFHKALKEAEEKLTRIRLVKFTADVLCICQFLQVQSRLQRMDGVFSGTSCIQILMVMVE